MTSRLLLTAFLPMNIVLLACGKGEQAAPDAAVSEDSGTDVSQRGCAPHMQTRDGQQAGQYVWLQVDSSCARAAPAEYCVLQQLRSPLHESKAVGQSAQLNGAVQDSWKTQLYHWT
jgi:hypothetical protein